MWRDQTNGKIYTTHSDLRAARPNVSAPVALTEDIIRSLGFDAVLLTPPPAHDAITQNVSASVVWLDGAWQQRWAITAASPAEVAERLEAQKVTVVTMRQARLALLAAGKLDAVAPAIASMPSPAKEQAQIEWEYSIEVQRNRPFVLALGPALGLDSAALDALFAAAAKL